MVSFLTALGGIYKNKRLHLLAEAYYMKAMAFIDELYGENAAVQAVAITSYNMGNNYTDIKPHEKAQDCFYHALDVHKQLSNGEDNEEVAKTHTNLGFCYRRQSNYTKAGECYSHALDIHRKLSDGMDNVQVASALYNTGTNFLRIGNLRRAVEVYS